VPALLVPGRRFVLVETANDAVFHLGVSLFNQLEQRTVDDDFRFTALVQPNIVRNLGELELGVGNAVNIILSRDAFFGWIGRMMRSLIELSVRIGACSGSGVALGEVQPG